jgi:nucleotide-binding universal stress UspA family protein
MAAGETLGDRERGVVLVPIDFEDASRRALDLAKELAPCLSAEVVLLHAYQVLVQVVPGLSPAEIPPLPGIHLEVEEAARGALNELADAHGGLRSILMEGDPASAILAEAERLRPRMVVMGTHGRAGLERVVLGSVAEKVVRRCVVPVTVVRAR